MQARMASVWRRCSGCLHWQPPGQAHEADLLTRLRADLAWLQQLG
jgi:hypothetical protein